MDESSPNSDVGKDRAKTSRNVGMRSPPVDPQGGNITEPPEPLHKEGLLDKLRKPREENRHPPKV